MNRIRFALQKDVAELKKIWKDCFGDSDAFIDYYFQNEFKADRVLLLEEEEIASMLTIIPVELSIPDNTKYTGAMLYAVATLPRFQGHGYSTKLMDYAKSYLKEQGADIITLVPATASLTSFYEKRGYLTGFKHQEITFTHGDLKGLSMPCDSSFTLQSANPLEYKQIRDRLLSNYIYQSYQVDELTYQKKLSLFSSCDIFLVCDQKDFVGCVIAEKLDDDRLLIKELLVPKKYIMCAMKCIFSTFPANLYTLRLPAYMGSVFGGTVKPFGMYQFLSSDIPVNTTAMDEAYLGIAYD